MAAIRLGLLVPQDGPAGLWAPSSLACTKLAVQEINERDGLLGRPVEVVPLNAGTTPRSAAEAAAEAIEIHDVDAIVGMFPSYARRCVSDTIARRVPFIYTPQFEGFERDHMVVTTGETSEDLLTPPLEWLIRTRRSRRFFLCGNDYVWPRSTFALARRILRRQGAEVVGEALIALDDHRYDQLLDLIRASRADVVMPFFLGSDSIQFNRAFAEAGLAAKMLRFTSAIDETVLYGLTENATENLYVSSGYFATVCSRNNGSFLERYHTLYGENPPPANSFGQSCYEGVHWLAALAETAGSLRSAEVVRRLGRSRLRRTARGSDPMPVTGTRPTVYLARVDGYDFTILNPS